ncbi:uncharacterized protein LOC115386034 isoform X1 [Salarias fasciatus]|uniref:uncharacterized protein LOC115386034 isoform X1 n=1 Tax=Salarias fasciatus TaxID=181472 RepID=UPI0011767794|nr:uncharacterized protein LOC115386034 isoform X1 [Salarias fasciatus]
MGSTCISGVTLGDSEGLTVERSPSNQDQLIIDLTTPPASPTPTRSSPAFGSLWTPAAPPPSPSTGPSHAFSSLWTPHTVGADRIAVVPPSRLNDPEREEEASGVASGVDCEEEGGQQASAEDRSEDVRGERNEEDDEVRNYFLNQENDYEDMTGHTTRSLTIPRLEDAESDFFNHVVPVIEQAFETFINDSFLLKERMLVQIYQRLR